MSKLSLRRAEESVVRAAKVTFGPDEPTCSTKLYLRRIDALARAVDRLLRIEERTKGAAKRKTRRR